MKVTATLNTDYRTCTECGTRSTPTHTLTNGYSTETLCSECAPSYGFRINPDGSYTTFDTEFFTLDYWEEVEAAAF